MKKLTAIFFFLCVLSTFSGCTEYWWERGQAPSISELVKRSQEKLQVASNQYGSGRGDILELSKQIDLCLAEAVRVPSSPQVLGHMKECRESFLSLDGKLSVGSRAPYGELSGQLRTIIETLEQGEQVADHSLGLFAARARFFLANELSMPKPSFG